MTDIIPMKVAGSARAGAAAVLVGVAGGLGFDKAASLVFRLCNSSEALRLDLAPEEIGPCVDALTGGPDFCGSVLAIASHGITLTATSLHLEVGPDVRSALALQLSRRGTGYQSAVGEIGGAHAG